MTQIERRSKNLRVIRENLQGSQNVVDDIQYSPQAHYNIGRTQNHPVYIPHLVQQYKDDPAIQVSYKLSSRVSSLN